MAQTNNFFYNPSFVDFIPGSPQVDYNFLKSVADDYKAAVEKQDLMKDQLLSGLASLDLHQTFSKDYADMMKNVDTQLEQLDNRYNGKLIDRNYGNELKSLIRNVQNDPNLRYMLNTTKELRMYEQQLRESKDYLNFNDPNRAGYQAVLNRVKGSQPLFTAGTIYADAKPDKELYEIASKIGIKSGTRFEYVVDENGMGTGVVYTIDEQTRTRKDITDKMTPYLETFRNTLGGQQLQREAVERGMSYEQLYLDKIAAMGPLLEIENMKSIVGLDPAWQAEMERTKIRVQQEEAEANRKFQARENELNRNQQEELQRKQIEAQEKLADEGRKIQLMQLEAQWQQFGLNLGFQYDQLNSNIDKFGAEVALKTMEAQLETLKNIYTPGGSSSGRGGGGRGGSSTGADGDIKTPLSLETSARFETTFNQAQDPTSKSFKARQIQLTENEKALGELASKIDKKYGNALSAMSNNMVSLIQQSENETGKAREAVLKSQVKTSKGMMTLEAALQSDTDVAAYRDLYAQSLRLHKDIAVANAKGSEKFFNAIKNNQQLLTDLTTGKNGEKPILQVLPAGSGLAERIHVDEARLFDHFGATQFAKDERNKDFYVSIPNPYPNTYSAHIKVAVSSAEIYKAYADRRPINSGSVKLSVDEVIQLVNSRDELVNEKIMDKYPVLAGFIEGRNEAFLQMNKSYVASGYVFNPEGKDSFATADANYAAALQNNISNLDLITNDGKRMKWSRDGFVEPKSNYSAGLASKTTYSQIVPNGLYIDRYGDLVVSATLYESRDEKGNLTGSQIGVILKTEESNVAQSLLKPLYLAQYENKDIAEFAAARVGDNAKWIASSFITKPGNSDMTVKHDTGAIVRKNVGGSYTVTMPGSGATREVGSEFQLATLLSLLEYSSSVVPEQVPGVPDLDMPEIKLNKYGPGSMEVPTLDDLIRDYNQLNDELDDPRKITLETRTEMEQKTKTVVQQTKDYIFDGPISSIESGGDYGAMNDKTPKGASRPTWAVGKYQFLPKWWDSYINDRATKYYGASKNGYHIYNKRNDQLGLQDIRGPQYDQFRKDPQFQEYVMKSAINDIYIPAYSRLDPKLRDKINPSDYFIVAHYAGAADAEKYFTDVTTGSRTLKRDTELAINKYLEKVKGKMDNNLGLVDYSEGMNMIQDYEMKIDYKLRSLPPGSTLILQDGTPYKKTSPVGVPNYEYTPSTGVPKSGINTPPPAAKPPSSTVAPPKAPTTTVPKPTSSTKPPVRNTTSTNEARTRRSVLEEINRAVIEKQKEYGFSLSATDRKELTGIVYSSYDEEMPDFSTDYIYEVVDKAYQKSKENSRLSGHNGPVEKQTVNKEMQEERQRKNASKFVEVSKFFNEMSAKLKQLGQSTVWIDPKALIDKLPQGKYTEALGNPYNALIVVGEVLSQSGLSQEQIDATYNDYIELYFTLGLITNSQASALRNQ